MSIRISRQAIRLSSFLLLLGIGLFMLASRDTAAAASSGTQNNKESRPARALDYTDAFNLPTGISPYYVVAIDLNKDGFLDLATSDTIGHSVTVFINRGNGTLQKGVTYPTRGYTPYALAAGDLDGDGSPDLVCGNMFSVTLAIFYNKGDGTFREAVNLACEPGPMFPVIADLDDDGKADIAVSGIGHDDVALYLNKGNGRFEHKATFNCKGVVPYSLVAADFNGDGRKDLATGNIYSANVSVMMNQGGANFAEAVTYHTDSLTQIIYAADLNGDKHLDLVTGNGGSDTVSVLINQGDGTFKPAVNYSVKLPQGVTAADMDGDGDLDIISANQSANTISVLLNNGDGTFAKAIDFPAHGLYPIAISVADLNNDGRLDMVTSNSGSNDISVLLNGVHIPKVEQVTPSLASKVTLVGGTLINPLNVKFNTRLDEKTLSPQTVRLHGSQSGDHAVRISYSSESNTMKIEPLGADPKTGDGRAAGARFFPGEQVKIVLSSEIRSREGLKMNTGYTSSFDIQPELGYGSFYKQERAEQPRSPASEMAVDLDGDGHLDLVSLQAGDDSITIYYNGSKGIFQAPSRLATGGFDACEAVAADFDHDGRLDIAIVNRLTSDVSVFYNEGERRFSKPLIIPITSMPVSLTAGDFNGDGLIDIATGNRNSKDVSLLFNAGQRRFQPPVSLPIEHSSAKLATVDFDGDGMDDLVSLNQDSDTLSLFRNNGDGTFIRKDELQLLPSSPRMVLTRDINQDGAADILTVNSASGDVAIFINNGQGSFRKPYYFPVAANPTGAALADVDGDGWLDLVVSSDAGLSMYLNQKTANQIKVNFRKGLDIPLAGAITPVAADFNGDGAPDLLSGAARGHVLELFANGAIGKRQ